MTWRRSEHCPVEPYSSTGTMCWPHVTGFEALSLAREHRDPIDMLITDVMMPRPGGPDLCRKLRDCHLEVESLTITNERIGEQMMRGITLTALGNSDA
jgi:CheY-like chemotaxis protein